MSTIVEAPLWPGSAVTKRTVVDETGRRVKVQQAIAIAISAYVSLQGRCTL